MRLIIIFVFALPVLSACSTEPAEDSTTSEQPAITVPNYDLIENFDTSLSIRTLMNAVVQPNALQLWQAVRYVVTRDGVEEDVNPQTDDDWDKLRTSAITLIETGNTLLITGRVLDEIGPEDEYPDYMYSSDEIKALIETDPEVWRAYIEQMQFFTRATLEAIENRDIPGLIETGATINNACQGCHVEFWYRRDIQQP